jgi:hypothetical protein
MRIRLSFLIVVGIVLLVLFRFLGLIGPSMSGFIGIENDMERELDVLVIDLLLLKTKHYEIPPEESKIIGIPVNSMDDLQRRRYLIIATDEMGRVYHNKYVSFSGDKTLSKNITIQDTNKEHINSNNGED